MLFLMRFKKKSKRGTLHNEENIIGMILLLNIPGNTFNQIFKEDDQLDDEDNFGEKK